jgi:hypothetical protein
MLCRVGGNLFYQRDNDNATNTTFLVYEHRGTATRPAHVAWLFQWPGEYIAATQSLRGQAQERDGTGAA